MAKLRIGPLPDDRPVKRTITFTAAQDALIRDYAAAIAAQDGLTDAPSVEKLVPIIVERFITTDRAFPVRSRNRPNASSSGERSAERSASGLFGAPPTQLRSSDEYGNEGPLSSAADNLRSTDLVSKNG